MSISFAAALRATCLVAVKGQVAKLFEHVSDRHLTHFNTTHLPKEPVNFKAKGAFMTAVSYKIMLYLYPPTYSHTQNFCLFKQKCFFKLAPNTSQEHFSTTLHHSTSAQHFPTTLLHSTPPQHSFSTTAYYEVLQSNTPTVRPPKRRPSSTTPYYKVDYQVLLRTTKRPSSTDSVLQSTTEASKTSTFKAIQNEHFVRGFLSTFQDTDTASKTRAFRAKPSFLLFKVRASKTRAFRARLLQLFEVRSIQNEHFLRGFLKFSSKKLSKWAFRARLLQLFKQEASKIFRLSRKMQKRPLTLKVWSAKRAFRARLPIKPFFNSCETSYKAIFTSDDFVRVFP